MISKVAFQHFSIFSSHDIPDFPFSAQNPEKSPGTPEAGHPTHGWNSPHFDDKHPGCPAKYIFNSCTCPGDPDAPCILKAAFWKKTNIRFWHRAVQNHHLVGGWPNPLKNMNESVGMIIPFPIWWESHKSHVPNHQRVIFNELNESKGPCSKLFLDFQRVDPRTVSEPPLNKKDVFPSVSSVENEEMCKTYIQKCTYVSIP